MFHIGRESYVMFYKVQFFTVHSSWDGYYKTPEQVKVNPMYKMFRDSFNNVVDIHTSGHADRDTIKKVIDIVNPKDEVIIIHKEADASL